MQEKNRLYIVCPYTLDAAVASAMLSRCMGSNTKIVYRPSKYNMLEETVLHVANEIAYLQDENNHLVLINYIPRIETLRNISKTPHVKKLIVISPTHSFHNESSIDYISSKENMKFITNGASSSFIIFDMYQSIEKLGSFAKIVQATTDFVCRTNTSGPSYKLGHYLNTLLHNEYIFETFVSRFSKNTGAFTKREISRIVEANNNQNLAMYYKTPTERISDKTLFICPQSIKFLGDYQLAHPGYNFYFILYFDTTKFKLSIKISDRFFRKYDNKGNEIKNVFMSAVTKNSSNLFSSMSYDSENTFVITFDTGTTSEQISEIVYMFAEEFEKIKLTKAKE